MKTKNLYLIGMIIIAIVLLWEQSKEKHNIWIQIIGIICFFYGMMKLSAKTPSKNKENNDDV